MADRKNKTIVAGGSIMLARKLLSSEIWQKPPFYLKLWIFILMKAFWTDGDQLRRGELLTSYRELKNAAAYKIGYRLQKPTKDQIYGFCDFLTKRSMAHTTKTTRGFIIKVLNYDLYQSLENYEHDNEADNNPTTTRHDRLRKIYIRERTTKETEQTSGIGYLNPLSLLERKSLADKFKTTEQTIQTESEKCYDWLISKGRRQKDYPAFFRNWLRKAIELNPRLKKVDLESLGYKYPEKAGGATTNEN